MEAPPVGVTVSNTVNAQKFPRTLTVLVGAGVVGPGVVGAGVTVPELMAVTRPLLLMVTSVLGLPAVTEPLGMVTAALTPLTWVTVPAVMVHVPGPKLLIPAETGTVNPPGEVTVPPG